MSVRDLIIVGAGPSGLSAAIAAKQRDLDYQVLEQGVLVNSIYRFPPQMVFFTTPELLEIGGLPFVSPYEKPTRAEALNYYRRVVEKYDLQISYGETVLAVHREDDVFALETRTSRGVGRARHGRNVLMAIGYYDHPNLIGVPGEDLPHVHHTIRTACHFPACRHVGGGTRRPKHRRMLSRRASRCASGPELRPASVLVKPDIENRIKEGLVAARFNTCVTGITPTSVAVRTVEPGQDGRNEELPADAVLLLTGYRSDSNLLRAAGVHLNERCVPTLNPETFETNVPGLFLAGGAVTGMDTSNIFIENGRFHGEKIVQVIAERINA